MILELFITLIAISLILVVLGYYMRMTELSVVGFAFLFILSSFVLLPRNLEYKNGASYVTNGSTSTITYNYATYDDTTTHYFGYFLSIISALGMIFVIVYMVKGEQ